MRPGAALRLALAGNRGDRLRLFLTALSVALAALTLFGAAAVLSIRDVPQGVMLDDGRFWDEATGKAVAGVRLPYTSMLLNDVAQRPRVLFVLALLAVPLLILAGQCTRIGAPARQRRLAGLRLAGLTPGQVTTMAATETALAGAIGVVAAAALYPVLRIVADRPDALGVRPLPTDVRPAWWWFVGVALCLPLAAAISTAVTIRRVRIGPLGVVRQTRPQGPRPWAGLLIAIAFGLFVAAEAVHRYYERRAQAGHPPNAGDGVVGALVLAGAVAACLGVTFGTAWIVYFTGRLLHRYARRPPAVLAGARMMADPWSGSRAWATLLACLTIGAGTAAAYAYQRMEGEHQETYGRRLSAVSGEPYVLQSWVHGAERQLQLLSYALAVMVVVAAAGVAVSLADAIVSRRRILASLVAGGTSRRVLARSVWWQTVTPLLPAVLLALAVGTLLPLRLQQPRLINRAQTWQTCIQAPADPADACLNETYAAAHTRTMHIDGWVTELRLPWDVLAAIGSGALLTVLTVTAIGLLFLRVSVRPTELRTT